MTASAGIEMGLAVLAALLVGWWLGSRSVQTLRSLLAGKEAELAARGLDVARLTGETQEQKGEMARLLKEKESLTADAAKFEQSAQGLAEQNRKQEAELRDLRGQVTAWQTESAQSSEQLKAAQQSLVDLTRIKEEMENAFKVLAGEILEEKSKSFSEGSQTELGTLLGPLKTQIEDFRKKVEEAQSDSKTGVTKLETLIGVLATQSNEISEKAENLTMALRGSAKAQGDWGEFILHNLLDKAGLREGEHYRSQQTFSGVASDDGESTKSVRTDVILFLPGGRNLVTDSKVSLTAYTDYVSAAEDSVRLAALKRHLASVRGHVNDLAKAGYHRLPGIETPDFVVMFVPVEPAFLLALQNDGDLWADAYQQGILLVGPTTLLYIIRIVNMLWEQEKQARNVKQVMERGAKLYDKFVGFVSDLEAVGKNLRDADQSYVEAMKKLSEGSGNLVRQVEMLKELGVPTAKSLPPALLDRSEAGEIGLTLAAGAETSEE